MHPRYFKYTFLLLCLQCMNTSVLAETTAYTVGAPTPATTVTVTPAAATTPAASVTVTPTVAPALSAADVALMTAVQQKIAQDSTLTGTNIVASSQNGWITLQGTATTQAQVDTALELARSTPGVSNVSSSIAIQPAATATVTSTSVQPTATTVVQPVTTATVPTSTTTTSATVPGGMSTTVQGTPTGTTTTTTTTTLP